LIATRLARALGPLLLAAGAAFFTLAVFEVGVRVAGYEPIYQVYSHPEVFWREDPLLGWSHEPGSTGVYVGPRPWPVEYEAPVRINSLGLRGPELAPLPEAGARVLLLGDSVTAGFEVPFEETFGARLEALLGAELGSPVQVVNAGVRGYGTDQSYLYYRDRAGALDADVVVMWHSANDLSDNVTLHRMRRIFGKGGLAPTEGGALAPVGYPIPDYALCSEWLLDAGFEARRVDSSFERAMCGFQTQLADRSALFTFLSMRIRRNPGLLLFLYRLGSPSGGAERAEGPGGGDPLAERKEYLTGSILRALADAVRSRGAHLLLIKPPEFLDPEVLARPDVGRVEIPVDLSQLEYRFENDSHLSARGHEVVAEALRPGVVERLKSARGR